MDIERVWADELALAYPGTDWSDALGRHGAFHTVILSPAQGLVARVLTGPRHRVRAALEHRSADACAGAGLSIAVPRPVGEPASWDSHSAFLLELLPGEPLNDPDRSDDMLRSLLGLLEQVWSARPPTGLRPPRAWAGGEAWPALVDQLTHGWPRDLHRAARRAVQDAVELTDDGDCVLVHGDFGTHNVLWQDGLPVGLLDWDAACVASRALDVAPLVGRHGVAQLSTVMPRELAEAGARYRASLPLQVAAAADLVGNPHLRSAALSNFAQRFQAGTLTDPFA